jgi:hypothetical protein
MGKGDYRLKGHESFIIREGWLIKGMRAVHDDSRLFFVNSGADALGVGTNMAKSIRYWMRASNLTRESMKDGVVLSGLGKTIFENDPYLEDIFSLWIIHTNIVCNFKLATSWNVFFNRIDVTTFRRDELISMMTDHLISIIGDSNLPERSIRDDCAAILQMYSDGRDSGNDPEDKKRSPFSALGLLHEIDNSTYEKSQPAIDQIDPLVILYMIGDALEREKAIPIDNIATAENMPGKVLTLNRVAINDYLDRLQNKGYIIVNRTAGLDVVYPDRLLTGLYVLNEHYKEAGIYETE